LCNRAFIEPEQYKSSDKQLSLANVINIGTARSTVGTIDTVFKLHHHVHA